MANETLNIQNGVSPITIDTEVTEGSMRPVTSDGIYKAIQAGGGGLPSVTSADEGKFAYVDENGEWQKGYLDNYNTRLNSGLDFTCVGNTLTYSGSFPPVNALLRAYNSHGSVSVVVHYGDGSYETIFPSEWLSWGDALGLYVPVSFKGAFVIVINFSDVVEGIHAAYISANKFVEITLTPTDLVSGTVDVSNSELAEAIGNRNDIKININAIIQGVTSDPSASGMLTPSLTFITNGQATVESVFYLPTDQNTYCVVITNGAYTLTII